MLAKREVKSEGGNGSEGVGRKRGGGGGGVGGGEEEEEEQHLCL